MTMDLGKINAIVSLDRVNLVLRRLGVVLVAMMADSLILKGTICRIVLDFAERISESTYATHGILTFLLFILSGYLLLRR